MRNKLERGRTTSAEQTVGGRSRRPAAAATAGLLLTIALAVLSAGGAGAQEVPVVEALIGEWEGEGSLFGAPATFRMKWERVLADRFLRLTFRNRVRGSDGSERGLDAQGYYRVEPDGGVAGTWFDSRGMVLPLAGTAEGSSLTVEWGSAETERGRTVYRVAAAGGVEVEDFVWRDGGYQQFGAAAYRRVEPGPAGPGSTP